MLHDLERENVNCIDIQMGARGKRRTTCPPTVPITAWKVSNRPRHIKQE